MKTFKEMLVKQLENIGKYEIEEPVPNVLSVWDKIDHTLTHYKFNKNEDLIDIY